MIINYNHKDKKMQKIINELIFKIKTIPMKKTIDVGSNMKNLKFEIIK